MERRSITINDSAWLRIESDRAPMHVGIMARFSLPPDAPPNYLADLVERWREVGTFEAPFNYRLHGSALPRWEVLEDGEIDLEYHFRHSALPAPGGERELGMLVSRLHTSRLNRRHPLWELHVIEGLADDRWALYIKVHHSQFDGMAGIRMLRRMLSVNPDDRKMLPPWAVGLKGPDQSGLPPREPSPPRPAKAGPRPVRTGLASARDIAGAVGRTYAQSMTGPRTPEAAVPFQVPRSILNNRVNSPRRFATQDYSMERMRALAKAADGSINDVLLAVCGGALRRYLDEVGDLPERDLTATVPVAVPGAEGMGNAITFLFTYLGTNVEDPRERMSVIQASTRAGKERLPKVGRAAMDAYTAAVMTPSIGQTVLGVAGRVRPQSNLVVSNVPGPAEHRYFEGSRLDSFYPVSLILDGQALNITAVSYGGQFNIGYTGCRDAVPHLQRIAVYSGEALADLEAAYGITG